MHFVLVYIFSRYQFESEGERQFKQILSLQQALYSEIKMLDSKISEILGKQEHVVSLVSSQRATMNVKQPDVVNQ